MKTPQNILSRISKNFFNKINDYDFHGPKGKVKSYQMTNYLLATVQQMDKELHSQPEVDEYNLGFGRVWAWFKYVLECRVKDIMVRRLKKDQLREIRQSIIE